MEYRYLETIEVAQQTISTKRTYLVDEARYRELENQGMKQSDIIEHLRAERNALEEIERESKELRTVRSSGEIMHKFTYKLRNQI